MHFFEKSAFGSRQSAFATTAMTSQSVPMQNHVKKKSIAMHRVLFENGFVKLKYAYAERVRSDVALQRILNCLVYVYCAVALGKCLVNLRSIRVEENTTTISQVTGTTKRQRGTLQKMMNYKKLSTHLYTNCQPISTQTVNQSLH